MVGPLLVEPIKLRSAPWKVAKSRIELLESLNQDPGLQAGGLTVKKVMEVCMKYLLGYVHFVMVGCTKSNFILVLFLHFG